MKRADRGISRGQEGSRAAAQSQNLKAAASPPSLPRDLTEVIFFQIYFFQEATKHSVNSSREVD